MVTRVIPVTRIVVVTVEAIEVDVCHLIGCADQLTINLVGNVPEDFIIEATAVGFEPQTAHCHQGDTITPDGSKAHIYDPICEKNSVAFFRFAPDETQITLRWGLDFTKTKTIQPQYDLFRPNGPDCEPECRNGTAEFLLTDE